MSALSVRQIVLTALSQNIEVDNIVSEIRAQRPESKAGVLEVKWYISKMKKDGYLDADAKITSKGLSYVSSIAFKKSKTFKPVLDGNYPTGKKVSKKVVVTETEEQKLYKFATSDQGGYKERDKALKSLAKLLGVPYEKKGESKPQRIERLANEMNK